MLSQVQLRLHSPGFVPGEQEGGRSAPAGVQGDASAAWLRLAQPKFLVGLYQKVFLQQFWWSNILQLPINAR